MVAFNLNTLIAAAIALMCGAGAYQLLHHWEWSIVIGLLCGAIFDLYQRFGNDEFPYPYLHPHAGAHVTFLPVWMFVIFVGVYYVLSYLRWV